MMILMYLWAAVMWATASYLLAHDLNWWQIFVMAIGWPIVPLATLAVFLVCYEDFQCLKFSGV